jgi:hypothetical protein
MWLAVYFLRHTQNMHLLAMRKKNVVVFGRLPT